jgi:LPS sulfotransferase NodH
MTPARFILLMPWGRVGSNLLMDILRQSAPMKLNNERFNTLRTAEEQEGWLGEFYEIGAASPSRPFIGSKQNMFATRDIAALMQFLCVHPFKVVRLRRENLVKAAISQIRAEQYAKKAVRETGKASWAIRKGTEGLGPSHIDPDLFIKRVGLMQTMHLRLMSDFKHDAVLDIEYEEINSSLPEVVERLRDHLGVPQRPYKVSFEKATPDDLSIAVENLSALRARLTDTPFADQL